MPCPEGKKLSGKMKSCVKQVMAGDPTLSEASAIAICRDRIKEESPIRLRKAFTYTSPVMFEIMKDATDEGEMILRGYATTEALDLDNDIIMLEAVAKAFELYRQAPTIRLMHQPEPVGLMVNDVIDNKGALIDVRLFNDPAIPEAMKARALVRAGGLSAYSIAGAVLEVSPYKQKSRRARRISGLHIAEISLVDTPSNRETFFQELGKSADSAIYEVAQMYEPEWLNKWGLPPLPINTNDYDNYTFEWTTSTGGTANYEGETTLEKQKEIKKLCQMKTKLSLLKELQKI